MAFSDRGLLTAYWFTVPVPGRPAPDGYGVSAYSLADALALLRAAGYAVDLAAPGVTVREGVTFAELDAEHVAPNMGPMQFRGVWYPRHNL